MALYWKSNSQCEGATIPQPDTNIRLRSCPHCLLLNPNYPAVALAAPPAYTPIANAVTLVAAAAGGAPVLPTSLATTPTPNLPKPTSQQPIDGFMRPVATSHSSERREEARQKIMEAKNKARKDLWDGAAPPAMGTQFSKKHKKSIKAKTLGSQSRVDAFGPPRKSLGK
jgi:hypothetical protein